MSSLLPTLLLTAFIIMKIMEVIDWPWIWVLSPAWIPLAAALIVFGFIVTFGTRGAAKTPKPRDFSNLR